MSYRRTTLFVTGFNPSTRARDLAYEFERYGRLVRCDIPAPRNYNARPFAFVEFEDPRDAEDALYEMGGRRFDGYPLEIQWARNAPSAGWRFEGGRPSPPPRRRYSRSPPPRSIRRRSKSPPPRRRSRSRSRSRNRSRERDRHRSRSRSPKNHSPTPPPAPASTSAREDAPSTSSNPPPATSGQDEEQAVTTEVAEADVAAE